MDEIVINIKDSLSQEYNFRRAGRNGEVIQIVVPKLVLEREARKKGMSLDQFLKAYSGQWFFNEFEGLLLRPTKARRRRNKLPAK